MPSLPQIAMGIGDSVVSEIPLHCVLEIALNAVPSNASLAAV